MVNYSYIVCIPKNTPESSSYSEKIELRHDTILNISILIPAGHMASTGIRIKYGPKQLMPHEPSTWIKGDNVLVYSSGPIRLPESPITLMVEGFNNSSSYDHCFYIYIDAIDWKDYPLGGKLDNLIDILGRLETIIKQSFELMGVYPPSKEEEIKKEVEEKEKEGNIIEKLKTLFTRG
ncbi:MAG: hypothetical protein DRJ60_04015 [Thermoprotei archaeon]|nr:MAG: hypothetical protein DRJ60_04015 [Thermoprotei archaeon]